MPHYNTTKESGQLLDLFSQLSLAQDEEVMSLMWFLRRASPSQVWDRYGRDRCPVTSIRRSMTDLTKEGRLVKTPEKITGAYGRPEHVWTLPKTQ